MSAHWKTVQGTLEEFIRTKGDDHFALMGFDDVAYDLVTSAAQNPEELIKQLRAAGPPRGQFTNIVAAVQAACDWLQAQPLNRPLSVVFISDGKHEPSQRGDSMEDVASRCRQMSMPRQVEFLAIGIPPSIDFTTFRQLLPEDRYHGITVSVGDLVRHLRAQKLSTLVRLEYTRARSANHWATITSVNPAVDDGGQRVQLYPGESAEVIVKVVSPFSYLRACLVTATVQTDEAHAGFSGGMVEIRPPVCIEPGEQAPITLPIKAAAADTVWERVLQRLRFRVQSDENLSLDTRVVIEPWPDHELKALGEFPPVGVVLAQSLVLPVRLSYGISAVIYIFLVAGIGLFGAWRRRARLHGRLCIVKDDGTAQERVESLDGYEIVIGLGEMSIHIFAKKVHPFAMQSNVYIESADDGTTRIYRADSEELVDVAQLDGKVLIVRPPGRRNTQTRFELTFKL